MDAGKLTSVVSVLVALSVASERLVEITKGAIPFLNQEQTGNREGWRRSLLQLLAVVAGVVTALLARPAIKGVVPGLSGDWTEIVALGLLASGGSGFWNAVLTYAVNVKDLKEALAQKAQGEVKGLLASQGAAPAGHKSP